MGQIYVAPVARVTDNDTGIGGSTGGIEGGGYWLYWNEQGYTGTEWYWNDEDNYLQEGWRLAVTAGDGYVDNCQGDNTATGDAGKHTASYESFLVHVQNGHVENLNSILSAWDPWKKMDFVSRNRESFKPGCAVLQ